jgi:hypothetical protein
MIAVSKSESEKLLDLIPANYDNPPTSTCSRALFYGIVVGSSAISTWMLELPCPAVSTVARPITISVFRQLLYPALFPQCPALL